MKVITYATVVDAPDRGGNTVVLNRVRDLGELSVFPEDPLDPYVSNMVSTEHVVCDVYGYNLCVPRTGPVADKLRITGNDINGGDIRHFRNSEDVRIEWDVALGMTDRAYKALGIPIGELNRLKQENESLSEQLRFAKATVLSQQEYLVAHKASLASYYRASWWKRLRYLFTREMP